MGEGDGLFASRGARARLAGEAIFVGGRRRGVLYGYRGGGIETGEEVEDVERRGDIAREGGRRGRGWDVLVLLDARRAWAHVLVI